MSALQPLMKAALVVRNDARAVESLLQAYLYQRRLIKIETNMTELVSAIVGGDDMAEAAAHEGAG